MSYYESVVLEYLRADRTVFVNTEYCIQINPGDNPEKGSHWYCDAVALEFRSKTILLCEFTYAANPGGLIKRLKGWNENWEAVRQALVRDSLLFESWPVRPWLFVPQDFVSLLVKRLGNIGNGQPLKFVPRITPLEMAQPWKFRGNRTGESDKPGVPKEMRT